MGRHPAILAPAGALLLAIALGVIPSASPADEYVARVPLPAHVPESVVPDRFVIEFKRDVAHRLDIEADALGHPSASVASVQRAFGRIAAIRAEREFVSARPQAAGSRYPDLTGYYLVSIPEGASLQAAMDAMAAEPDVDHVEPIGIHPVDATPNDTYFAYGTTTFPYDEWHLWDLYGIDADLAWDLEKGKPTVLVGIIDTGVKYRHTDLGGPNPPGPADNDTQGNVWVNPGEIPANGVDDDADGYVDDVIGYDFVDTTPPLGAGYTCSDNDCGGMDNDPNDGNGHGTHVAGTVAAITNNARAVAGIAGGYSDGTTGGAGNGCKIVPCRIGVTAKKGTATTGFVDMAAAARAMNYLATLVDKGFDVAAVNCSWGSSNSGGLDAAANNLLAHDVMIITAAGNNNNNIPSFLAAKAGVMAVGATDSTGVGASFTSFGSWVHLAAPGVAVMSTYHDPTDPDTTHMYVGLLDGTSMSTPHAVGVAALLESYNPALTRTDKFNLMVNNTTPFGPGNTKALGSGILNARLALLAAPPPVGVAPESMIAPRALALLAAPNPARGGADLVVRALPGGRVRVAVVDVSGRQVRELEGVASSDGGLRLRWDGRDAAGRRAGTGLYMIQANAGRERAAAKLVVLE
jgi:subtilisin family serine protease